MTFRPKMLWKMCFAFCIIGVHCASFPQWQPWKEKLSFIWYYVEKCDIFFSPDVVLPCSVWILRLIFCAYKHTHTFGLKLWQATRNGVYDNVYSHWTIWLIYLMSNSIKSRHEFGHSDARWYNTAADMLWSSYFSFISFSVVGTLIYLVDNPKNGAICMRLIKT